CGGAWDRRPYAEGPKAFRYRAARNAFVRCRWQATGWPEGTFSRDKPLHRSDERSQIDAAQNHNPGGAYAGRLFVKHAGSERPVQLAATDDRNATGRNHAWADILAKQ